jgi:ectoine hydroxylase-related dioxygenase (phytanoyl-CoA dioxygenase family)
MLSKWCQALEQLPETPGKWMKYFEQGEDRRLCRVENFLDYDENFFELANSTRTLSLISQLMGEKALLFKEKINVKYPGGSGFAPHQDAPAFITFKQKYHITMMLAIDDSTIANGCLRVIDNNPYADVTLKQEKDGSIDRDIAKKLNWIAVECKAGDVLLFDSYLPHYSESNQSANSRRAAFITYSRASEGKSMRSEYFADKREKFPQDCERVPGKDYSKGAQIYNVANPIK